MCLVAAGQSPSSWTYYYCIEYSTVPTYTPGTAVYGAQLENSGLIVPWNGNEGGWGDIVSYPNTATATFPSCVVNGSYLYCIAGGVANGGQGNSDAVYYAYLPATQSGENQQGCIIATAAYGSELAAPVQFLRNFRDQQVQHTYLGSQYLIAFNNWYYSWAPAIAQRIAPNENYKATTRAIIGPLIGSLFVSNAFFSVLAPLNPELAVVATGLIASSLIGLVYLTPVYAVAWKLSKRRITKRTIYGLAIAAAAGTFIATTTTGTFNIVSDLTALTFAETLLLVPALVLQKITGRQKCFL
jgi:hypothetical protein